MRPNNGIERHGRSKERTEHNLKSPESKITTTLHSNELIYQHCKPYNGRKFKGNILSNLIVMNASAYRAMKKINSSMVNLKIPKVDKKMNSLHFKNNSPNVCSNVIYLNNFF